MNKRNSPPITILTGPRGDGKSLFCRALAEHDGVGGLFSPACEERPGQRYGIDAVVVPGEDRWPLARVENPEFRSSGMLRRDFSPYTLVEAPAEDRFDAETAAAGISVGPYLFSASALSRAGNALRHVAMLPETRLVIVDEIGPLELDREEGLFDPLRNLLRGDGDIPQRALLLVVRPSLVVPLCRLIEEDRPGCNPETVSTRDFPNPGDVRTVRSLS